MDKLSECLQLSEMLGWGDILSQIALPACEEILHISGKSIKELSKLRPNEIFGFLGGADITHEDYLSLISVRSEIEYEMRHGVNHQNAISEWWK